MYTCVYIYIYIYISVFKKLCNLKIYIKDIHLYLYIFCFFIKRVIDDACIIHIKVTISYCLRVTVHTYIVLHRPLHGAIKIMTRNSSILNFF